MDLLIISRHVFNALLFSIIGLVVLGISFIVFDRLTPGSLWKEIVEEHNVALAIAAGSFTIAMSLIIAAAINS